MASISLYFTLLFILDFMFTFGAATRVLNEYSSMMEKHNEWMARYHRVYPNEEEKTKRFQIFKERVEFIESFNSAGNRTFKVGLNEYSDLTPEEFMAHRTGYIKPDSNQITPQDTSFRYAYVTEVPSSMDWRERGAVTDVKNQERCGCCWAFSAAAAVEGIYQITTGKLISLSAQQLLDCNIENKGCDGGNMDRAFDYITQNGITTFENYPYQGIQSYCRQAEPEVEISGHEVVPRYSESALLQAVANQPVSIGIDASCMAFHNHQSGIYTADESCGTGLNHAITLVGYGVDETTGMKYWLAKNQWGTSWGEDGYIKLERDVEAPEGVCGLAMDASYPVMGN